MTSHCSARQEFRWFCGSRIFEIAGFEYGVPANVCEPSACQDRAPKPKATTSTRFNHERLSFHQGNPGRELDRIGNRQFRLANLDLKDGPRCDELLRDQPALACFGPRRSLTSFPATLCALQGLDSSGLVEEMVFWSDNSLSLNHGYEPFTVV